jgi:hypothetical protein
MFVTTKLDVIIDAKRIVKYCVVGTFLIQTASERIGNTEHFMRVILLMLNISAFYKQLRPYYM